MKRKLLAKSKIFSEKRMVAYSVQGEAVLEGQYKIHGRWAPHIRLVVEDFDVAITMVKGWEERVREVMK